MNPPSKIVVVALAALLLLGLAFCVLAVFTFVLLIRRFIIIPKFRKEYLGLHTRRAARARLALAGDADGGRDDASTLLLPAHTHAFSGWVDLGQDGTVTIAGQSFRPNEVFEAIARDAINLPRAKAAGNGKGEVLIFSHGQSFRAEFTAEWNVQLLEGD